MKRLTKTEKVLIGMLQENTGSHFLDSGGAYGRHHETNQGRNFRNELASTISFNGDWIDISHNVFHFLSERLEVASKWDAKFQKYVDLPENEDKHWLELMEEFADHLKSKGFDADFQGTRNTYNGEDLVSQVLQYVELNVDDDQIVLLQIHGGCDVRGGYTRPRAFFSHDEHSLYDNTFATVVCSGDNDHNWHTDDACNLYFDGGSEGLHLEKYPMVQVDAAPEPERKVANPDMFKGKDTDAVLTPYEYKGQIAYEDNGNGYCPLCGNKLEVY